MLTVHDKQLLIEGFERPWYILTTNIALLFFFFWTVYGKHCPLTVVKLTSFERQPSPHWGSRSSMLWIFGFQILGIESKCVLRPWSDWLTTGFANVTTWTSTLEVIPFQSVLLSIQLDTRLPSSGIIRFSRIPISKGWPRTINPEPARLVFRIPVQTNKHIVWRTSANRLIFSSRINHNEMGSLSFAGRFCCIPGGWLGRELVARVMKTYPVLWTYC